MNETIMLEMGKEDIYDINKLDNLSFYCYRKNFKIVQNSTYNKEKEKYEITLKKGSDLTNVQEIIKDKIYLNDNYFYILEKIQFNIDDYPSSLDMLYKLNPNIVDFVNNNDINQVDIIVKWEISYSVDITNHNIMLFKNFAYKFKNKINVNWIIPIFIISEIIKKYYFGERFNENKINGFLINIDSIKNRLERLNDLCNKNDFMFLDITDLEQLLYKGKEILEKFSNKFINKFQFFDNTLAFNLSQEEVLRNEFCFLTYISRQLYIT